LIEKERRADTLRKLDTKISRTVTHARIAVAVSFRAQDSVAPVFS